MRKIDGSFIRKDGEGNTIEKDMFAYDPLEQEEIMVNKANSSLMFTPEFIPYHLGVKYKYGLSHLETLVYGFIRFYKAHSTNRFYFTDEQMGLILGSSTNRAGKAIRKLNKIGLIKTSRRIKAGGGQIRFVNDVLIETPMKLQVSTDEIKKMK